MPTAVLLSNGVSAPVRGVVHVAEARKRAGAFPGNFDVKSLLRLEYVKQAAGDINSRFGSRGFE